MSTLLDWLIDNEPSFRRSRLPSLFSDLTVQKTTNPEGYAANVTAWSAALIRAAGAGKLNSLDGQNTFVLSTGDELMRALASQTYGTPTGLGHVIDECIKQGKFIDVRDFEAAEESIYAKQRGSWIPSPWTVVNWGLRQAGVSWGGSQSYELSSGKVRRGRLVIVPVLEEVWERIQPLVERRTQGLTDRVMARDTFAREVGELLGTSAGKTTATTTSPLLSEQDLQLLLRFLSRDKQILSYDGTTVKLTPPSATPEPITHEDHSIASLKSLISSLQDQTDALSTRITALQTTAATAVKQGNKPSALSALRSKKLAERTLTQRLDTLSQLEQVYDRIESAASQVEILQVMESSAATLKGLNKRVGGIERVEDVLESLRVEVEKVDEVSTVLAEPGAVDQKALLDEEAVDDELEAMEREEREKQEELKTRRRLEELDALEEQRRQKQIEEEKERQQQQQQQQQRGKENVPEGKSEEQDMEAALSSSIEKLRALELDTNANANARKQDTTSAGIAEPAS